MTKTMKRTLLSISVLLFVGGCASPVPAPNTEKSPTVEKKEVASSPVKNAIHVRCSIYRIGTSARKAGACKSIDFALEDENDVEISRKNPDRKGKIDFPVPPEKAFHVIPKVPSSWTIEIIPSGDLKAGDSVRVILRR
jgi:hypothetical protein